MPKLTEDRIPKYRLHKQSGQAIVTLSGKDCLLGPFNSKSSRTKYDRLTSEWLANGRRPLYESRTAEDGNCVPLTITNLCAAYWRHCKTYHRGQDGTPSSELGSVRSALRPLKRLYGDTPAIEFGPLALRAVRDEMIRMGWARTSINRQISRVRHAFRWAVSQQLLPPHVIQALETLEGLRYGKTKARETDPVKPVSEAHWQAILPHCSRQVAAVVELQAITGMRPTEALTMRRCDIDTTGDLWLYRPHQHKNFHRGHDRVVYLGPRAQEILGQFITLDADRYLFRPRDAETERRETAHELRRATGTPLSCGNGPGNNRKRKPRRQPGERYDKDTYARAIARACDKAFPLPDDLARKRVPAKGRKTKVTRWETNKEWKDRLGDRWEQVIKWRKQHRFHPHQLRHTAGTEFRKRYGVEAAQVILGHRTLRMAELYAEQNVEAAKKIMSEAG